MKVKTLIKELEKVNPNMDVYCTSATGVFDYGVAYTAKPKMIHMADGDGCLEDNQKERLVFVIDEQ